MCNPEPTRRQAHAKDISWELHFNKTVKSGLLNDNYTINLGANVIPKQLLMTWPLIMCRIINYQKILFWRVRLNSNFEALKHSLYSERKIHHCNQRINTSRSGLGHYCSSNRAEPP